MFLFDTLPFVLCWPVPVFRLQDGYCAIDEEVSMENIPASMKLEIIIETLAGALAAQAGGATQRRAPV